MAQSGAVKKGDEYPLYYYMYWDLLYKLYNMINIKIYNVILLYNII